MSLRARLLAGMVALVAVGLGVAAIVTYEEQRSFLLDRVHQQVLSATGPAAAELQLNRNQIPGLRRFRGTRPFQHFLGRPLAGGDRPLAIFPPGTFGELRSSTGKVIRRRTFSYDGKVGPNPILPAQLPVSRRGRSPRFFNIHANGPGGGEYVAVAVPVGQDTVLVAVPLHETKLTLHRLIVVEALVGGGVILALIVLGWFVIRLGLRPLERIGRVASEIAGGDLSRRVTPTDPRTEVGRLGLSLNEMLNQIEDAFHDRSESEERLRHFLADASHELRTPLASIRGYAELFRLGAADDPATLERAMTRIEAEAARMGVLVEDLLLLAQLDQIPEARRIPVDLRELAEHAAGDTRVIAPQREVTLEADGALRVLGDPDRLRQLLANLLRNAVIHTPSDSPIDLRLSREPAWAVLEVRDHGPGLPPDALDQVFERFWRTEGGRSRGRGGAGLGLAIVEAIVEAHGGEISAENAPDGGAVFRVRLPLVGPSAADDEDGTEDPTGAVRDEEKGLSGKSQPSHGTLLDGSPTLSNR